MPIDINSPEGELVRKMVPFSTMSHHIFKVICQKITVETVRSGTFLFKRGDTKNDLFYLLKGEVSLEVDKLKMEIIKAGSESSRFALAHQLPRKTHAMAKGSVRYARLNIIFINPPNSAELAKKSQKNTPSGIIRNVTPENRHDWIATLLMIPVIRALPPANMHKISETLEEIRYLKDDIVFKQGDAGNYFYLIKDGQCEVSHKKIGSNEVIKLAKLQTWDTFGEAELILNLPRKETITATSNLSLLQLKKPEFLSLIKQHALQFIDYLEMEMLLAQGGILIDVRTANEFKKLHLEYAINLPFYTLRAAIKDLDIDKTMIVSCFDGDISEAAAFLLLTCKFSVKILRGGIKNAPEESLKRSVNTEPKDKNQNDVIFGHSKTASDKTKLLAAENNRLRQMLKELTLKFKKSELEKSELEREYRLLLKQSNRLKQMLKSMPK